MANSNDYIDEMLEGNLERTAHDKGWKLTIELTFYDNGKFLINGRACIDEDQGAWTAGRFLFQLVERAHIKIAQWRKAV